MTAFLLFGCVLDAGLVLALWLTFGDAVRPAPPRRPRAPLYVGPERRRTPRPVLPVPRAA